MIGFFQTWSLVEQSGSSISVIFPKSKYCWHTLVTFYYSVDLYQREEWAFSWHRIRTFGWVCQYLSGWFLHNSLKPLFHTRVLFDKFDVYLEQDLKQFLFWNYFLVVFWKELAITVSPFLSSYHLMFPFCYLFWLRLILVSCKAELLLCSVFQEMFGLCKNQHLK